MDFDYQKRKAKNMFKDAKNKAKGFDTDQANKEFQKFKSKMGSFAQSTQYKFQEAQRKAQEKAN